MDLVQNEVELRFMAHLGGLEWKSRDRGYPHLVESVVHGGETCCENKKLKRNNMVDVEMFLLMEVSQTRGYQVRSQSFKSAG